MPDAPGTRIEPPDAASDAVGRLAALGYELRWFDEIDSTNRHLLDEARAGAPEGVVVVADHQTAGRGRQGRTWTAPPGASLLVSILVRPTLGARSTHLVTMAAGVAACEAVFVAADFAPSLKWPNDLLVGDRKLAGMLSEADLADGQVRALVVGIGINVEWTDFPAEIAEIATACNLVAGRPVDRFELLATLVERFDRRYRVLGAGGGPESVVDDYRHRCTTLGRRVRVEGVAGAVVEGTATDVDSEGRLLVATDAGTTEAVAVGDVVHVRPA